MTWRQIDHIPGNLENGQSLAYTYASKVTL